MSEISEFAKERYAQSSMTGNDFSAERVKTVVSWLPKSGKLLEIGVWDGSIVRNYRPAFEGEIYGTDLSEEVMRKALPLLKEAKACDLNRDPLPWDDATFDCVVCCEVIEHIVDTDRLLAELRRVLKPGGVLVLSTPNLASGINRLFVLLGWQPLSTEVSTRRSNYGNPLRKPLVPAGHVRSYTCRALREQVSDAGFFVEKATSAPVAATPLVKAVEKLFGALSPSLGSDVVLRCRRKA